MADPLAGVFWDLVAREKAAGDQRFCLLVFGEEAPAFADWAAARLSTKARAIAAPRRDIATFMRILPLKTGLSGPTIFTSSDRTGLLFNSTPFALSCQPSVAIPSARDYGDPRAVLSRESKNRVGATQDRTVDAGGGARGD